MDQAVDVRFLRGVPLNLEVEVGRRKITLGQVLRLKKGSVIPLSRGAGSWLDVFAGNSLLGHAEVVFGGGKKRVQLTEIGHDE
jgi:flagellar motor switch protein FliN/FliY